MLFSEYQALATRTAKMYSSIQANLIHSALGIATEGGEFTAEVKRCAIYEKPLTDEMRAHMVEELGDLMWYVALAAEHLGVPLDEMARLNIEELSKRYPEKYFDKLAEDRLDKRGTDARNS